MIIQRPRHSTSFRPIRLAPRFPCNQHIARDPIHVGAEDNPSLMNLIFRLVETIKAIDFVSAICDGNEYYRLALDRG